MFETCRNQVKFCHNSGGLAGQIAAIVSSAQGAKLADRHKIKEKERNATAGYARPPRKLFHILLQLRHKMTLSATPCSCHIS
jgi:hypothetical protein